MRLGVKFRLSDTNHYSPKAHSYTLAHSPMPQYIPTHRTNNPGLGCLHNQPDRRQNNYPYRCSYEAKNTLKQ